ncbi:ester cyclase [Falsiroseomonas bella]|nr:ester cyclase [Falsiroseomonas bella]
MGGCGVLDEPCETPEPDPPSPPDEERAETVRSFVARVWNHCWTADENKQFVARMQAGDRRYVPPAIAAALEELRTAETVRHRHDGAGRRVRSSGPDDYRGCVNRVYEVAQELRLDIKDLAVAGNIVTARIEMSGLDCRADGRTDLKGAFGAPKPTQQRFRVHLTTMYRVAGGKVLEDWLLRRSDAEYEPRHGKSAT